LHLPEKTVIRLIVPLTLAVAALHAGQAFAQSALASPFPSEKRSVSESCMKGFAPLREEAEKRGKLIRAASERHARPDETCKLIGQYSQAELKMMKYIDANLAECGASPQIVEQLRNGHKNTETIQKKVCAVAQQAKSREPAGPVGDFWPAGDFGVRARAPTFGPPGPVGDFGMAR
jgi:hypothetical protein